MSLDTSALAEQLRGVLKGELRTFWPEIKEYAKTESLKLAQTLAMIETLRSLGKLSPQQAELHLQIQKNAMRSVLLTVEGLGLLAAEQAINQALALVKDRQVQRQAGSQHPRSIRVPVPLQADLDPTQEPKIAGQRRGSRQERDLLAGGVHVQALAQGQRLQVIERWLHSGGLR